MADYPAAIRLWQSSEGIGLSKADEPEQIWAYLERNPGCSFVARVEEQLAGAVLSGTDGRRGYIQHLAVAPRYQHQGIGKALVAACLDALAAASIDKVHIFVYNDNQSGLAFWQKNGWLLRDNLVILSIDLPETG